MDAYVHKCVCVYIKHNNCTYIIICGRMNQCVPSHLEVEGQLRHSLMEARSKLSRFVSIVLDSKRGWYSSVGRRLG